MAKKSNTEIFLKDYQAPAYLIDAVELDFELHPKKTKVYSKIKFRKNPNQNSSEKFSSGAGSAIVQLETKAFTFFLTIFS